MNSYLIHIQQPHVMSNDEYSFDHESNLHRDHVRIYKQELSDQIARVDRELLYNSIEDQDDHKHLDVLVHDLR